MGDRDEHATLELARPAADGEIGGVESVTLAFSSGPEAVRIARDLSGAARIGKTLFVACDETASVERLQARADGRCDSHETIPLGPLFRSLGESSGEVDIEALAIEDNWLWVAGSHSLKRGKPKSGDSDAHALRRVAEIEREAERHLLGRLPLVEEAPGLWAPVPRDGKRVAGAIPFGAKGSDLMRWLQEDKHLDGFLKLPSKENGFDIEGLAVSGMTVWLGLRGPVIGGRGVVLQLELKETKPGRLKPRKFSDGNRHRKFLLPGTGGLGIRDLYADGKDLLVLAGPTMAAAGPSRILRWRNASKEGQSRIVPEDRLGVVAELRYGADHDRPEAVLPWPEAGEDRLLILHDSPAPSRLSLDGLEIRCDIVRPGL